MKTSWVAVLSSVSLWWIHADKVEVHYISCQRMKKKWRATFCFVTCLHCQTRLLVLRKNSTRRCDPARNKILNLTKRSSAMVTNSPKAWFAMVTISPNSWSAMVTISPNSWSAMVRHAPQPPTCSMYPQQLTIWLQENFLVFFFFFFLKI